MKTELKKIDLDLQLVSSNSYDFGCGILNQSFTYELKTNERIDLDRLKFFEEVEVPETIGEWIKKTGIPKHELVSWLNKHYNTNL